MSVLYFTRHGRTVMNDMRLVCGNSETELTQEGIKQALTLADQIIAQNIHIDEILSSPLSRALKTAELIGQKINVPFKSEERLRERDCGIYENTNWDTEEFQKTRREIAYNMQTGETVLHTVQRIYNLLDELTNGKNAQKIFLLVGHNGIARAVESYFRNMTTEEFCSFKIKNCELRKYTF